MKRNEDLVVCTDGDKDNETVIGLMEDALKCRLGAVEREMEPSKELLKKEPLENLRVALSTGNIACVPKRGSKGEGKENYLNYSSQGRGCSSNMKSTF